MVGYNDDSNRIYFSTNKFNSMDIQELRNEVSNLIVNNQFSSAFILVKENLNLFDYPNSIGDQLVIIISRYNSLQTKNRTGVLSLDQYQRTLNGITHNFQELIGMGTLSEINIDSDLSDIKKPIIQSRPITMSMIIEKIKPLKKDGKIKYSEAIEAISELF